MAHMDSPKPPRPFNVDDRVRSKTLRADGFPVEAGLVLELRDRQDIDTLLRVDGKDPAGYWRRSAEYEIEDPNA